MTTWTAHDPYGDALTATYELPYPTVDTTMSPGDVRPAGVSFTVTKSLTEAADWDVPFRVAHDDGGTVTVDDRVDGDAPDVSNDPTGDVIVSGDLWTPLTGHTGQHGYNGAVMHPSEILAGGLARDILAAPGVYVVTEVRDDAGDYPDGDPIGWAVLKLTEEV